jgi:hypothetical protein
MAIWGVRKLFVRMVFSVSGRVQNRIINTHEELMDDVTIWALCGEKVAGISAKHIVNN